VDSSGFLFLRDDFRHRPDYFADTPSGNRKLCCIFSFPDAETAAKHRDLEFVESYGDSCKDLRGEVHYLHAWDDGERTLLRCRKCGALFLQQSSEFHGVHGDDSYYTDLFPVESRNEALAYNRKYNGFEIKEKYTGTWIWNSNAGWQWNKHEN
jgi:hypothetical protein